MSDTILKFENISKQYRLGLIGTGTLSHDLNRWWHRIRGRDDPYLKIGQTNDRTKKGTSEYVWALRDINFEVKRGDVVGIIGKNGAGKSTLLKILSKVTSPTTGVIKTKGRIASLLEVGTGFHLELTGRENIYLNGAILGMTKAEIGKKFDEIVAFSGCERYIDTPVKRYSSGMKVRLAFAVAAHLEPEILVVDEVLAVGDAEFQQKAIGKMRDITIDEGRTVLFVSHNMAAVRRLCKKGIVLSDGAMCFEGEIGGAILNHLKTNIRSNKLDTYKDRKGNGIIKFREVRVFGANEFLKPISGAELNFLIKLDNPSQINSRRISFDMRIDDDFGQRLIWISSQLKVIKVSENVNYITVTFPRNPFNKGTYYGTIHISVDKDVSDWIQNAFEFEVSEGDFFGSGKLVPVNQSKILSDFDIKLQ